MKIMNNRYEHTFFTSARLKEFWQMVEGLLKFAAPSVLIFVAISAVGLLLVLVIKSFKKGANSEDDENKDYDIKYYD